MCIRDRGEYGITVNCILPGPVPTQHNSSRLLPRKEAVEQKLPMRRLGQPENIAIIERILKKTLLKVEVGGGIRSLDTIARLRCV